MNLAIEELSPVPGSAVLLNNINVVLRFSVLMGGALFIVGTVGDGVSAWGLPAWSTAAVLVAMVAAQWGLPRAVARGFVLRQVRYGGLMQFSRDSTTETLGPWRTEVPERIQKRPLFQESLASKLTAGLETVPREANRALILIGRNEADEFSAKVYHSCVAEKCEDISKHFSSYDEIKNGLIHWGDT